MSLFKIPLDWSAPDEKQGEIYFIQMDYIGPIKIGWARNAKKRISILQTGNPYELRILHIENGTRLDEQMVHSLFSRYHIRGEWFHPDKEIIEYIDKCREFETAIEKHNKTKMESRNYFNTQTGEWIYNAEKTLGEHLKEVPNGV